MNARGAILLTTFALAACGDSAGDDPGGGTDAANPTPQGDGGLDPGGPDSGGSDAGPSDADPSQDGGQTVTVSVQIVGTGTGAVISEPPGIDCGSVCSFEFPADKRITLTAVPAAGSALSGWSGDCTGSDACVVHTDAARSVTARFEPGFSPVLLSTTDKSDNELVVLSEDRLAAHHPSLGTGGVRSERAVEPGSGIFYFEGILGDRALRTEYRVGVATSTVPLESSPGETDQALAVITDGAIRSGGPLPNRVDESTDHFGMVVDYSGPNPRVHVIGLVQGVPDVALSRTLTEVTEPLYIMLSGQRRALGPEMRINPGNDTVNFPFYYDPESILAEAGIALPAPLTLGWGQTRAAPVNATPTVGVGAAQTIDLGDPVSVSASASDAEDGDLTASVLWEDLATPYGDRTSSTGGDWTFVPEEPGLHPLRATVVDSIGQRAEAVVEVTVVGTVPQENVVELVEDPWTGRGIVLSADNLAARYTAPQKSGIRANQGLLDGFQYFEVRRDGATADMGGGVVTRTGFLDPYRIEDAPPSMSVNSAGGIWRNFVYQSGYNHGTTEAYGFAVDYRGINPIVYVITLDSGGNPTVEDSVEMYNCFVPVYPMIYGDPRETPDGSFDNRLNFGATPFAYDPQPALRAAGVDLTGFELGWGAANTP